MRYGVYRYRKFNEIFETVDNFLELYNENGMPKLLPEANNEYGGDMTTIYYMLLARYGNSPIASSDESQFVNALFLRIFQYAPTWAKKLEVQGRLRALTEEEIKHGAKAIYNHASNPSTAPVTTSTETLGKIDSQSVTSYVKTTMEGYAVLTDLLRTDVTEAFLNRFSSLFNPFVMPDAEAIYCEEE